MGHDAEWCTERRNEPETSRKEIAELIQRGPKLEEENKPFSIGYKLGRQELGDLGEM